MPAWYAVKSLYRTDVTPPQALEPRLSSLEERIVLMRADSFDDALEKAESEARQYAGDTSWLNSRGETVRTRYLEGLDAFSLKGGAADGEEVYSKLLFVPTNTTDEQLVNRWLGHESEQHSADAESFEPDIERSEPRDIPPS